MKKVYLVLIILCLKTVGANAQSTDNESLSFMVYGSNFLTSIILPNTWDVDMVYAREIGANGFFYLRNYSINNSPALIILNLAYKPNEKTKLEDWVEHDINNFLEYYSDFTAEEIKWNVATKNGYRIIIYSLKPNKMGSLEYSAYLDVGLKYFVNINVTIKDQDRHDEIVNDFKKCLENSKFFGMGIEIIE